MSAPSRQIAVIGGGYAGLAAAYDLARAGHQLTIYEASATAGGLAAGFRADHWEWPLERFYHHLFTNDDAILTLADELGIGARMTRYRPKTMLVHEGRPHAFDGIIGGLTYPGLSLVEKARVGLTMYYLKLQRNWRPFERVTAHDWLRRWMGSGGYERTFEPLLYGKFGDGYKEVPMAWFWARVFKRTPSLIYPDGGFQSVTDALVGATSRYGATLHLESPVERLEQADGGWWLSTAGEQRRFDSVISTVSPQVMGRMAPALPAPYLAVLASLQSLGAVVLTVALDRPLTSESYWINLDKRRYPLLALVEHTNMVSPAHYGGDHLIYLGDYLPADHPYLGYDAERLFEVYEPVMKQFNPTYQRGWLRALWSFSAAYAQPIPPLNYSSRIPPVRTPLPGLYFASMSQVYPWDRGTNYAIEIGRDVARLVQEDLAGHRTVGSPTPGVDR